jgi:proton-dependent oligopeptide transporter, POT family
MSKEKTLFGHPVALFVLFFTEMWERFSYYGMRAILMLYLVKGVKEGALGLPEETGGAIYGLYTAAVYLLTLPGGWIADNILGQKKAIWWGGIVIMIGHLLLACDAGNSLFFTGLCVVALGTGLLKANISSIVGELYPDGGVKRDAAFSIFYLGINLGGFLGMLIVGLLGEKVGWHYGFGAAAIAMLLGVVNFKVNGKYLANYGNTPKVSTKNFTYLYTIGAFFILFFVLLLFRIINIVQLANIMKYVIITLTLLYFIYIGVLDKELTMPDKKRVLVLFLLFIAAALFWSGYEQGGSTLTLFADRHTNRSIFGWAIPASWFQNAQSFFILTFSAPIAALWLYLDKRKANPTTSVKFGISLLLLALAFVIMYVASNMIQDGSKVGPMWLVGTFMFTTLAELFLSPVGLSAYTKLAPAKYYSQMMGLWFVATALGNLIAGLLAGDFTESNTAQMPAMFLKVVLFCLGIGILLIVFFKPIKRLMGGVR